tara:strand:- start:18620 stop:18823 length:204 start_codon:yes stop_codon:yes gene_type:complete
MLANANVAFWCSYFLISIVMIDKFIKWHKDLVEYFMKEFNISHYGILWIAFFEGLIFGSIIMYFYLN